MILGPGEPYLLLRRLCSLCPDRSLPDTRSTSRVLADLEWASEQSVRLYRTRLARHKDVVREGEQRLDQRQPTFSCCGLLMFSPAR